jgi:hypothetical protein
MLTPSKPPKAYELLYLRTVIWRMRFWLAVAYLCVRYKWKAGSDYAIAREEHLIAVRQRWRQMMLLR